MTQEQRILNELSEQKEMVREIHLVISGNPKYGQPGIKDTLSDHGERIGKVEDRMDRRDKAIFKTNFIVGTGSFIGGALSKIGITKIAAILGISIKL